MLDGGWWMMDNGMEWIGDSRLRKEQSTIDDVVKGTECGMRMFLTKIMILMQQKQGFLRMRMNSIPEIITNSQSNIKITAYYTRNWKSQCP